MGHYYIFICVQCCLIAKSNDALQRKHRRHTNDHSNHKIVVVRRGSERNFLAWLEGNAKNSLYRQNFTLIEQNNEEILIKI